ncbi:MAG: hypothetical protein ACW99A_14680 [Candidatus Kariarchaeaceae archaeon]|jgi:hypothetical protein
MSSEITPIMDFHQEPDFTQKPSNKPPPALHMVFLIGFIGSILLGSIILLVILFVLFFMVTNHFKRIMLNIEILDYRIRELEKDQTGKIKKIQ